MKILRTFLAVCGLGWSTHHLHQKQVQNNQSLSKVIFDDSEKKVDLKFSTADCMCRFIFSVKIPICRVDNFSKAINKTRTRKERFRTVKNIKPVRTTQRHQPRHGRR